MADNLPINFPVPAEPTIASYTYTDIADGSGMITFYGFHVNDNTGGAAQILSSSIVNSNLIGTTFTSAGSTTYNYNHAAFKAPRTVGAGIGFAQMSIYKASQQFDVTVAVKKVSGSTTTIGTSTMTANQTSSTVKTFTIPIDITQTHFKIGDILRISVTFTRAGSLTCNVGHDPLNRAFTNIPDTSANPTQLKFWIPFRLDV